MSDAPISDAAWARIIEELRRRRFVLHVRGDGKVWLEQVRWWR